MTKHAMGIGRAAALGCAMMALATAGHAVEPEAGTGAACLSGPKGAAPAGQRWYYRVDRASKQKCWYTRGGDASRTVAARKPPRESVEATDDTSSEPLQPAVANARAEAPPAFVAPPAPTNPLAQAADATSSASMDRPAFQSDISRPVPARAAIPTPPVQKIVEPAGDDGNSVWMWLGLLASAIGLLSLGYAAFRHFTGPHVAEADDGQWDGSQWDDKPAAAPPLAVNDEAAASQWDGPPMNWVRIAREHADQRDEEMAGLLSRQVRMG